MFDHLESFLSHLTSPECELGARAARDYSYKCKAFDRWRRSQEIPSDAAIWRNYRDQLRRKGLRPRTIRVAITALRYWFVWARERGLVEGLPSPKDLKLPRLDGAIRATPTDQDMDDLWAGIDRLPCRTETQRWDRERTRCWLILLTACGIRRSELLRLDVADVDRTQDAWKLHIRDGKGGESDWVPMNTQAQAVVRGWLRYREAWARVHLPIGGAADALFPVDHRRRMGDRALYRAFVDLKTVAGLADRAFTFHGIRHWAGTKIEQVSSYKGAQTFLRHSSLQVTQDYLHKDREVVANAVEVLRLGVPRRPGAIRPADPRSPQGSHNGDGRHGGARWRRVGAQQQRRDG